MQVDIHQVLVCTPTINQRVGRCAGLATGLRLTPLALASAGDEVRRLDLTGSVLSAT